MAGLQDHLDDRVDLVLVKQTAHQLEAVLVRGHAGAADVEVAVGDCLVDVVGVLVDQLVDRFGAAAVFVADDVAAVGLDALDHLHRVAADGAAGDQDARALFDGAAALLVLGLDAFGQGVDLVDGLAAVKLKVGAVQHRVQVGACHRRRVQLHQLIEVAQGQAVLVGKVHLLAQLFLGDLDAEFFFQLVFEGDDLLAPELAAHRGLAVWQLHDVGILDLAEHLVHLLLAVAGGLADNQVGEVEEGALLGLGKAVAGFDQRAEVARQVLLRFRDGLVGEGAQADRDGAGGHDDLGGGVGAEGADKGDVLLLDFVGVQEGIAALFAEFFEDVR